MTATPITATWGNGKPLAELERLVMLRQKELGETARDSAVAAMITVLRSLRADTRVVRPARAVKTAIAVEDATGDLVSAWTGRRGSRKGVRCVRRGGPHGPRVSGRVVNLAGAYTPGESIRVYRVTDRGRKTAASYLVLARTKSAATEFAYRRRLASMRKYKGLARFTLGAAMGAIGGRGDAGAASGEARTVGMRCLATRVITGLQTSVTVSDALNYAALALKSGPGGVARAMAKAANSITGYLKRRLEKAGKITDSLRTPFPELKGR